MTFNEYQLLASKMESKYSSYTSLALGLASEAGEVAGAIKKNIEQNRPPDLDAIKLELGDVLWYLAVLAANLGFGLGGIAQANLDKLNARWPEGYGKDLAGVLEEIKK